MHVQPEALGDAAVYLRIIFLGMPFTCLYNIYAAALRSVGDPARPCAI
jgi:Na+-driven multidrug efflux pump